jgi:hypothetical protein
MHYEMTSSILSPPAKKSTPSSPAAAAAAQKSPPVIREASYSIVKANMLSTQRRMTSVYDQMKLQIVHFLLKILAAFDNDVIVMRCDPMYNDFFAVNSAGIHVQKHIQQKFRGRAVEIFHFTFKGKDIKLRLKVFFQPYIDFRKKIDNILVKTFARNPHELFFRINQYIGRGTCFFLL